MQLIHLPQSLLIRSATLQQNPQNLRSILLITIKLPHLNLRQQPLQQLRLLAHQFRHRRLHLNQILNRRKRSINGGVFIRIRIIQPMQILHQELKNTVLNKRINQNPSRLVVLIEDVFVSGVLKQLNDVNGDIGVVVVEDVNDGWNDIEVDEVRVKFRCSGEDLEFLKLQFGVGEAFRLVRVLEASFDVLLEAAFEGEDEFLEGSEKRA